MKENKYKGKLDRCEVESIVALLRDKEPTPAWRKQFKDILKHYDWTKNGSKTINDHLDVLVDYLSKPVDPFEAAAETLNDTIAKPSEFISKTQTTSLKDNLESTTMSLRERLEKEREEGKWPSVDERIKEKTKNASKSLTTGHIDIPELIKAIDEANETNKVHVKRIKKYNKRHKSNNIYITIKIGR